MVSNKKNIDKNRMKNIILFFIGVLFILVLRISWIMLINGKEYSALALEQWTNESDINGERGNILDRNGNILALSNNMYQVSLNLDSLLEYVDNNDTTLEDISKSISNALNLKNEYVINKLNNTKSNSLILARNIEKDQVAKIKELNISGITITSDIKRHYPNNNFASHLLGNINYDGLGINGIEAYYNKELTAIPGIKISQTNAYGGQLAYSEQKYTNALNGKDITLTIDEKIQFFAEEVASKAYKEHKPDSVTIVVMNPNNGEVLAMVNKPDFDPNNSFSNYEKFKGDTDNDKLQNMWKNSAISKTIEPGSIFKVITAAIAIEENIAKDNEKYYCSGSLTIDNTKINCWKGEKEGGHGLITIEEALESSCNVVFMNLAAKIGKQKFYKYIEDFKLTQLSGIDLPGEVKGITKSLNDMGQVDLATISFGQTNTLNIMQYMKALNSIANGGSLINPHVMKEISYIDINGNKVVSKSFEMESENAPISDKTINKLKQMLESTVRVGSSKQAYIDGYSIAGKTGTAEKINKNTGTYDEEAGYISSFAGFAPYDNPEISLIIAIDNPKSGNYFGGIVAAPYANTLFDNIFNYLQSN